MTHLKTNPRSRHEQEWSNGAEFPGILGQPRKHAQNFGMKFRKMSRVPFAPQPGISGTFGRMESSPRLLYVMLTCFREAFPRKINIFPQNIEIKIIFYEKMKIKTDHLENYLLVY